MNERIKAIGRQAGFAFIEDGIYGQRWYSSKCGMDASEFEKFAELLVRECSKIIVNGGYWNPAFGEKRSLTPPEIAMMIKDYFGVEE